MSKIQVLPQDLRIGRKMSPDRLLSAETAAACLISQELQSLPEEYKAYIYREAGMDYPWDVEVFLHVLYVVNGQRHDGSVCSIRLGPRIRVEYFGNLHRGYDPSVSHLPVRHEFDLSDPEFPEQVAKIVHQAVQYHRHWWPFQMKIEMAARKREMLWSGGQMNINWPDVELPEPGGW